MNDSTQLAAAALRLINSKVFPMIGIVEEVDDDGSKHPQGLYPAIKIRFMEVTPFVSPWIRWGTKKAGEGVGDYWLPDIGDEVIVIYTMGSVYKPLIAFSLWNGVDKPPAGYKKGIHGHKDTAGNFLKICELDSEGLQIMYQTGNGHTFNMCSSGSETGESKIELETEEGHKVELNDTENLIQVVSAGNHSILMDDNLNNQKIEIKDPTGNYFIIDTKNKSLSMHQILGSFVSIDSSGMVSGKCGILNASFLLTPAGIATLASGGGMFSVNKFGAFSGLSAGGISFNGSSFTGDNEELHGGIIANKGSAVHSNDFLHSLVFQMPDGTGYEFDYHRYHNESGQLIDVASGYRLFLGNDDTKSPTGENVQSFGWSKTFDDEGEALEEWYQAKTEMEDIAEHRIYRHKVYDPEHASGIKTDDRACTMSAISRTEGGDPIEVTVEENTFQDDLVVGALVTEPTAILSCGTPGPWIKMAPQQGNGCIHVYCQHSFQVQSCRATGGLGLTGASKYNMNLFHSGRAPEGGDNGQIHIRCEEGRVFIESEENNVHLKSGDGQKIVLETDNLIWRASGVDHKAIPPPATAGGWT